MMQSRTRGEKILLFLSNFFSSFESLSSWNRATLREQSVSASSLHWPRPRENKQIRKLAFFFFCPLTRTRIKDYEQV
jgi:hypothetical protein